jgi:hypothetical protein
VALTVGDVLAFGVTVRDASGSLANATQVMLSVTLPDGTAASGSPFIVAPTSTGTYGYDLVSTMAGRYTGYWVATGLNSGAHTQAFDVDPTDPGHIISLAQAKAQLNITSTSSDDELELYLAAVTRIVEKFVGPVVVRTYTQVVAADRPFLSNVPRQGPGLTPVLTLTSLTPLYTTGISTWLTAGAFPDPNTGELRQASGQCIYGGPWTAVYTAGQRVVDPTWQLAASMIVQHLWKTQRGASALPLQAADETFIPEVGYAIPNRAADLLRVDGGPSVA